MIKTKDFILTDANGLEYDISATYEDDGDITSIIIKGDIKDLLSYQAEHRIYAAFHRSFENDE